MPSINCLLCNKPDTKLILRDDQRFIQERIFYECRNCAVIFVDPDCRLGKEDEYQRYQMHQNDPDDQHYRNFLRRLFEPVAARIKQNSSGLDFGSGPGPVLHRMFEDAGHSMKIYDLFYHPDETVFEEQYDFITASETAEHLFEPLKEFDRLWSCLKSGGYLGVMTSQAPDTDSFKEWYYKDDDTHVVFYRKKTFEWLANRWEADLEVISDTVVIFKKT